MIATLSPNARLQRFYVPSTTYVIVPLFGLANAGFVLDADLLARAWTSPITLGIVLAYVVGKPAGVLLASWAVTRLSHGRIKPPVGWLAVAGSGTIAGVAFTVSLLIATLAFDGPELAEAKLGILATTVLALAVTAAGLPRVAVPERGPAYAGDARHLDDAARPRRALRRHPRPLPRATGRERRAHRVRRLRVPALRAGRAGRPGRARRTTTTCCSSGATCR